MNLNIMWDLIIGIYGPRYYIERLELMNKLGICIFIIWAQVNQKYIIECQGHTI